MAGIDDDILTTTTTTLDTYQAINSRNANDVTQQHYDYIKHSEQIQLVNDVYDGVDTTKQYLNQFPQELYTTFKERQERSTLRNFVKRSTEAFVGMIFRKPIEYGNYGPKVTKILPKINTKDDVETFSRDLSTALIKDSKTYILVDSPSEDKQGALPYLLNISRSQLVNWRKDENDNFTLAVIYEIVAEPVGLFGTQYVEQYRVYDADANITLWRKKQSRKKKGGAQQLNTKGTEFKKHGKTIETDFDYIPLVELDLQDVPILYDIAKMNIKHYNRQSHKDRYLTMAALPIPVIWGAEVDDKGNPTTAKPALVIGVDEAFIFTGTKQECDFEWRELDGSSIQELEKDLDSIVEDITTGILRAADSASAVQKTATEVQLLQAEASSRVSVIASIVENGMKEALALLADACMEDVPENATFIINKDFNSSLMGSDGARVVFEQYLAGLLSTETFLKAMSDMELITIGSAADEMIRIKEDEFMPKPRIKPTENSTTVPAATEDPLGKTDNRTKGAMT